MTFMKKLATASAVTALFGVGALVTTTTAASAYTACNRYGECWQVRERYAYPAAIGVRFYDDGWYRRHHGWRHHHWRYDHDYDRGYWRNGVWIQF